MIVIPKGRSHRGTELDGKPFRAVAIKTPPQAPDDMKQLP